MITTGSARNPSKYYRKKVGNICTRSYDEEKNAINLVLGLMIENNISTVTAIWSVSLSLIASIESRLSNVMDIIGKLRQLKGKVVIHYTMGAKSQKHPQKRIS